MKRLATIAVVALAACATGGQEDAASSPPLRPAALTTSGNGVFVARLDGEYVATNLQDAQKLSIAPGKRIVLLRRNLGTLSAQRLMWFVAKPGESYIAKSRNEGYSVRFWIEDSQGREPTGGNASAGDEPLGGLPR